MEDRKWTVYVDDNYHSFDGDSRYYGGAYDTLDEAVAACVKILEESLASCKHALENYNNRPPGAAALLEIYRMFGEDPFIIGPEPKVWFSAWDYAEMRCREIYPEPEDGE